MSSVEPMAILECDLSYGGLTIGGVDMLNAFGAWCAPDLSPLWGNPDVRGADALLPGATGVRPFPRRGTITVHSLRFLVSGQVDGQDGLTAGEHGRTPEQQLALNLRFLNDNVFDPVGSGTGTRAAVWTPPGVAPILGDVRARMPAGGVALLPKGVLRGTMEIEDPRYALHL